MEKFVAVVLGDRLDGDSGVEGEAIGMSRYKG
jgi:hypothetical protein